MCASHGWWKKLKTSSLCLCSAAQLLCKKTDACTQPAVRRARCGAAAAALAAAADQRRTVSHCRCLLLTATRNFWIDLQGHPVRQLCGMAGWLQSLAGWLEWLGFEPEPGSYEHGEACYAQ